MLTIMTDRIATTKATAPGKMVFGTYGMKVDHMTYNARSRTPEQI